MAELVRGICGGITQYLDVPFSFFGHSMGALICFEVARTLAQQRLPQPQWVFVSGSVPPHRLQPESLHTLPTQDFIEIVSRRYSGFPPAVLENQQLLELFTPILRADFELIERYRYMESPPLVQKIAAFGGRRDDLVSALELEHWRDLTARSESFRIKLFDGGHFFLNGHWTALLNEICDAL